MLHFQLKEIPEDFFVDIVSRNNFLTVTLQVGIYVYQSVPQENINLKLEIINFGRDNPLILPYQLDVLLSSLNGLRNC